MIFIFIIQKKFCKFLHFNFSVVHVNIMCLYQNFFGIFSLNQLLLGNLSNRTFTLLVISSLLCLLVLQLIFFLNYFLIEFIFVQISFFNFSFQILNLLFLYQLFFVTCYPFQFIYGSNSFQRRFTTFDNIDVFWDI